MVFRQGDIRHAAATVIRRRGARAGAAKPRSFSFFAWIPVILPACVLLPLGWAALRQREYVLVDDAYIAFRYASNFARGHGLVWNPGEHVEGYTDLLWILLLSPFAKLGLNLTAPAVLGSLTFAAATVVFVGLLGRRMSPSGGRLSFFLPGLLLATNPSFDHAATSGMESTCFGFLVLVSLHCLVLSREESRFRFGAMLGLSATYLVRPEGALVALVALTVEGLSRTGTIRARLRSLLPIASAVALVIAVHVAIRFSYYGYPLPNTFYAKVIPGHTAIVRGAAHFGGFLIAGGWVAFPGILEVERPTPLRPWILHGYALLLVYVAYLLIVGGDHPYWYRFYIPLLPLPFLATSQLVTRWGLGLGRDKTSVAVRQTIRGVALLAFITFVHVSGSTFGERSNIIGHADPGFRKAAEEIAWFFRHEVPDGSLVAAMPVGHVGYYVQNIRILDMWGLNNVHIAHLDVPALFKSGHDKYDLAYVASQKPDYAYMFRFDVPEPLPAPGYDICWPSRNAPFVIYRRNFALADHEIGLGVPPGYKRYRSPPPPCRPPP